MAHWRPVLIHRMHRPHVLLDTDGPSVRHRRCSLYLEALAPYIRDARCRQRSLRRS
ncbi:hypothetical protein C8Q79DRAFT_996029 [Trametes meyenii]|nr:hypothetical protein C8Q79DRAFT_996029 [Trametes meyenii]